MVELFCKNIQRSKGAECFYDKSFTADVWLDSKYASDWKVAVIWGGGKLQVYGICRRRLVQFRLDRSMRLYGWSIVITMKIIIIKNRSHKKDIIEQDVDIETNISHTCLNKAIPQCNKQHLSNAEGSIH